MAWKVVYATLAGAVLLTLGCAYGGPPSESTAASSVLAPSAFQQLVLAPSAFQQLEATRELGPGAKYSVLTRMGTDPVIAHIVELDLNNPNLRIAVTPANTSRGMESVATLTSDRLSQSGADIAINASYFLPFAGGTAGADDYYPHVGDPVSISGFALARRRVVSPAEHDLDIRINATVCFSRSEIAIVDGQGCPTGFSDGIAAVSTAHGQQTAPQLPYFRQQLRHDETAENSDWHFISPKEGVDHRRGWTSDGVQ